MALPSTSRGPDLLSALLSTIGVTIGVAPRGTGADRRLGSGPWADDSPPPLIQDELLGLISHELRTPVTTIYGNAQLLVARRTALGEPEQVMLADILADSERLLATIDNLLLLARLEAGAAPYQEPLLLTHHVRAAVEEFAERRDRPFSVVVRGRAEVVVDADRVCISALVRNLLANADAYSPAGRRIDVVIRKSGSEARVSILDRGIGFGGEPVGRLTRPFFRGGQARRLRSGMGLGLAVCERIVEGHGGRLWALDRPGGGANAGFVLPLMSDPGA